MDPLREPFIIIGIMLAVIIHSFLGFVLQTGSLILASISNSMSPTFNKGDLIVAKGVNCEDIRVGDVIAYETP